MRKITIIFRTEKIFSKKIYNFALSEHAQMDQNHLYKALISGFKHTPTSLQNNALQMIAAFLLSPDSSQKLFLLKGFAGTGKTSITVTIIQNLPLINYHFVLLAPTGRAAKVMSHFTNQQAFTIHKHIYYPKSEQGNFSFRLRPNRQHNTLFIVDEASMIAESDLQLSGQQSLLDDLMQYVYAGKNCKLLLMGDTAQLPPVGALNSPALDSSYLEGQYHKDVTEIELTEVVRQKKKSGILYNATALREELFSYGYFKQFQFDLQPFRDIIQLIDSSEVQDAVNNAYDRYGLDETSIIVRSNKRAVIWNQQIRRTILDIEDELSAGDLLMVVKNNYFWFKNNSEISFIANGDTLEVLRIHAFREEYGFRFAEISAQLLDYPNQPPFDTVIILNTLTSEHLALTYPESQALYQEVLADYADEPIAYKRYLTVKNDPYYNALQVKYAYAMTCHKSQGGQWDAVFIEKPFLPDGIDEGYLRWLYTALTRAKKRVYLVGFPEEDFLEPFDE